MDPATILALIAAAMPLLQELIAMGIEIAKAIQEAQGTPAALALQKLQAAHAALVAKAISSLATAIAPK
jgi:hypothetical protein